MKKQLISPTITTEEAYNLAGKVASCTLIPWVLELSNRYKNSPRSNDPLWNYGQLLSAAFVAGYIQGRREERSRHHSRS